MMTSVDSGKCGPCCSTAATGRIARASFSAPPAKSVVVNAAHCTGKWVKPDTSYLASPRLASYVSHTYRSAGNDTDPAGVLSMFIDRLDEEDQPETPAKAPKAEENPSGLIDKNLFK